MILNILTLGCSKNLVDSEHLMAQFRAAGYRVVHNDHESPSDVVIINTCGFILDAKEESVDTILSYLEQKREGCPEYCCLKKIGCHAHTVAGPSRGEPRQAESAPGQDREGCDRLP